MSKRYKIFGGHDDAIRHLLAECQDWKFHLVRCDDDGKPVEWIASDGGEPEDQLLCRDWKWVAVLANKLDTELQAARGEIERKDAALRAAREALKEHVHVSCEEYVRDGGPCRHRHVAEDWEARECMNSRAAIVIIDAALSPPPAASQEQAKGKDAG